MTRYITSYYVTDMPAACGGDETCTVQVAAAYEIVGNPDRRAAFDDFGVQGDMANEAAGAGFDSWADYKNSGKQATKDFYSGKKRDIQQLFR
jgi:DnaJ-class molecular chaperone